MRGHGFAGWALASLALCAAPAYSSYAIYIGKDLTSDGSVFLGGSR